MFAFCLVAALNGVGLAEQVAVISDRSLPSLHKGIAIGPVMPDADSGGPLAVIRNGDMIHLDFRTRRIQIELSNAEMEERLTEWRLAQPKRTSPPDNSLMLKPCWCSALDNENYLAGGHSIHAGICMRRKMLTSA